MLIVVFRPDAGFLARPAVEIGAVPLVTVQASSSICPGSQTAKG